jgi:hypothetical protein
LSGRDLNAVQEALFRECEKKVADAAACKVYGSYEYIASGWEWSAFRDGNSVIKIPAGIFPETSRSRYVDNAEYNYEIIKNYIDSAFITETVFSRALPNIRQPFLRPIPKIILFRESDCGQWRALLAQFLALLDAEDWLPDLDIRLHQDGFAIRSIMADDAGTLKLTDFTAYFDVFRLYETRMRQEIRNRRKDIEQILRLLRRARLTPASRLIVSPVPFASLSQRSASPSANPPP